MKPIAYIIISLLLSIVVSTTGILPPLRTPFAVVEITVSTVEGVEPSGHQYGSDQHGRYIGFGPASYAVGQRIISVMVYNPLTNWDDDIIARWDVLTFD